MTVVEVSRATASQVGTVGDGLIYLFLAFQLIDQTVLPLLVITFLVTSAKRHPTLVNVCLTWIFTGIFGSLLLYTGTYIGPEPPKLLCVTQAALLDAVPPMTSIAVLALMFQTHQSICKPKLEPPKIVSHILLIVPYLVFFCFAITSALIAMNHPEDVSRSRRVLYCSLKSGVFSGIFAVFTAAMLLATMSFQVAVGVFMYRNWRALRQSGSQDIQTVTRVILFGSYVFLSLILSLLSIFAPHSPLPDLFTASVGTILALSIGSHPDIYRVWFCRPSPAPPTVGEHEQEDLFSIDAEKRGSKFGLHNDRAVDVYAYPTAKFDAKGRGSMTDISAKVNDFYP